jgi:hypothetical protein
MKILLKPWFLIPFCIITLALATNSFLDLVKKHKKSSLVTTIDKGQITDHIYHNKFLGWEFVIPEGYESISDDLRDEKLKNESNGKFDSNSSVKLIGLKKKEHQTSTITSSIDIRSFFPNIKNSDDFYNLAKDLIDQKVKDTETLIKANKTNIIIDKLNFEMADFIYFKHNNITYYQKMIYYFSDEYLLTITIGSDNQNDLNELFENLKKSTFSI